MVSRSSDGGKEAWWLSVPLVVLLLGCTPQRAPTAAGPLGAPFDCTPSPLHVVRRVQADSAFWVAALAIGHATFPEDSAVARKQAAYVCESLDTLALAEPAAFTIVYGPAYQLVVTTDIVFAVGSSSSVMLNPVHDGRVVGGLDVNKWNAFVHDRPAAAVAPRDARSLACLLRAIAIGQLNVAACQAYAPLDMTLDSNVWQVRFADYQIVLRTDGVILEQ